MKEVKGYEIFTGTIFSDRQSAVYKEHEYFKQIAKKIKDVCENHNCAYCPYFEKEKQRCDFRFDEEMPCNWSIDS